MQFLGDEEEGLRLAAGKRQLAEDMLATMYDAPGIGLAATQIGVMKQIFVMDCAGKDEARELLRTRKIERVIVVDEDQRAVGLITMKDIEKAQAFPNAAKDEQGRLLVGAASTVGNEGFERSVALIEAGVDMVAPSDTRIACVALIQNLNSGSRRINGRNSSWSLASVG